VLYEGAVMALSVWRDEDGDLVCRFYNENDDTDPPGEVIKVNEFFDMILQSNIPNHEGQVIAEG